MTAQPLDRETAQQYRVVVLAIDGGVSERTGTATVLVNVGDVNDNIPRFLQTGYEATVPENRNN